MNRVAHYNRAEELLEALKDFVGSPSHLEFESRSQLIAAAQVHATLASVDFEVVKSKVPPRLRDQYGH